MMFSGHLMSLPGPAELCRVVIQDLLEQNCVVVGVPKELPSHLVEEYFVRAIQDAGLGACDLLRNRMQNSNPYDSFMTKIVKLADSTERVVWADARDIDVWVSRDWNEYLVGTMGSLDRVPRICIVLRDDVAGSCRKEKHFRRRLWHDYVTDIDSRVVALDHVRRFAYTNEYIALKIALVASLSGANLFMAEEFADLPLRRLVDDRVYSRYKVWSAQVAALLPLVDRERMSLLDRYEAKWRLPHDRGDGAIIRSISDLEISDLWIQAKTLEICGIDQSHIRWLRDIRNCLAHMKVVSWKKLRASPVLRFY